MASLNESLSVLSNPQIKEIIALGIGKISELLVPRYQFALVLCLCDLYKVKVKLYDPLFNKSEIELIESYTNCLVLKEDCCGKFQVSKGATLFYLPHCPKYLTNNLLATNWGLNLINCIIIANSFNKIIEELIGINLESEFIAKIQPYCLEIPIYNTFRLFEVFNDTSVHILPQKSLGTIPDSFWLNNL